MTSTKNLLFILVLLACTSSPTFAQKALTLENYTYTTELDDNNLNRLVANVGNMTYNDPYNPTRYHLLGYVYYQRFRNYDILKDYKGANLYADSAFFYFQKARDLLTNEAVKDYDDFYVDFLNFKHTQNVVQNAPYGFIRADLDSMVSESFQFKRQASGVYTYFNRALENYKRANTIYIEICERFETEEDLLLLADRQFFEDIDYMSSAYDSTEVYFANYKNALKNFPIKKYNQTYSVRPIEVFQKEGKERANFFDESFSIWDYKKWQREIKSEIDNKISVWRERIQVYEDRLNAELAKIEAMQEPVEETFTIDENVLETITQYEKNSVLAYLFNYKVSKLNLFNRLNFKADSNTTFQEKAKHIVKVMAGVKSSRERLADIGKSTSLSLAKHRAFFQKNYADGLPNYIAKESLFLDSRIGVLNRQLEVAIRNELKNWQVNAADSMVADEIILKLSPNNIATDISLGSTQEGNMITLKTGNANNGVRYVSGFTKQEGVHKGFLAATKNDSLLWIKYPTVAPRALSGTIHTEIPEIKVEENGGVLAAVYSFVASEKGFGHTTLMHFDSTGNPIKTVELEKESAEMGFYPRYIGQAKAGYQLVLKGYGEPTLASYAVEKTLLLGVDAFGKKTWGKEIDLQGEVVALTPYAEQWLLLTNFKDLRLEAGENFTSNTDESSTTAYNIALSIFNSDGDLVKNRSILSEQAMFAKRLIAVDGVNGGVGIIGLEGEPIDLERETITNKPLIAIFDAELIPISENFE